MRFRRWLPMALGLAFIVGCGWAAWRVREVGRPVEETYAKIQVGMTTQEAKWQLSLAGGEHFLMDDGQEFQDAWLFPGGYTIIVLHGPELVVDRPGETLLGEYRVSAKRIERPDWSARLKLAFGW